MSTDSPSQPRHVKRALEAATKKKPFVAKEQNKVAAVKKSSKKVSVVAVAEPVESCSSSEHEEEELENHDDDDDNDESLDESSESRVSSENPNKKSKSEVRSEAKKVKLERQSHRPHNDTVQAAKHLWERVRRCDQAASERVAPLAELFVLLTGKFKEIIAKHDASRMVQTCVKYGNPEQRLQIATELSGAYPDIAKSRYGKHIVKRLLQLCPSVRKSIVSEFRGQVGKLIRHADASSVLEEVYSEYANGRERNALLLEFYGPEFILFQKRTGDEPIPTLKEILSDCDEMKREKILKYVRDALDGLINKGSLQHTIIHRLMLEYVQNESAVKVQDWISTFEEKLVEILHTFEGARLVSKCLALATAKQRKNILKSFKAFIPKIAKEEYGHQVLLVAFACVDDTVLMRSVIISELIKNLREYLDDKHAGRLIIYLLAAATNSTNSVLPAQAVLLLKESVQSAATAGTSKKDSVLRNSELLQDLIEPLSDLIGESELDDIESTTSQSYRLDQMLETPSKHSLLLEASLALPEICSKLLSGPAADFKMYESADFRAIMKKWARKCSVAQAREFLDLLKSNNMMKEMTESESAYILFTLVSTKPEIKSLISVDPSSVNEHAQALLQKMNELPQ